MDFKIKKKLLDPTTPVRSYLKVNSTQAPDYSPSYRWMSNTPSSTVSMSSSAITVCVWAGVRVCVCVCMCVWEGKQYIHGVGDKGQGRSMKDIMSRSNSFNGIVVLIKHSMWTRASHILLWVQNKGYRIKTGEPSCFPV